MARTKWQSNKRCDGGFLRFKSEECEGYIKISIDGVKKFESAVKKGLKKHHKVNRFATFIIVSSSSKKNSFIHAFKFQNIRKNSLWDFQWMRFVLPKHLL